MIVLPSPARGRMAVVTAPTGTGGAKRRIVSAMRTRPIRNLPPPLLRSLTISTPNGSLIPQRASPRPMIISLESQLSSCRRIGRSVSLGRHRAKDTASGSGSLFSWKGGVNGSNTKHQAELSRLTGSCSCVLQLFRAVRDVAVGSQAVEEKQRVSRGGDKNPGRLRKTVGSSRF